MIKKIVIGLVLSFSMFACASSNHTEHCARDVTNYSYIETITETDRGRVFRYLRVPSYAVRPEYILSSESQAH